jgi:hypothetical protein
MVISEKEAMSTIELHSKSISLRIAMKWSVCQCVLELCDAWAPPSSTCTRYILGVNLGFGFAIRKRGKNQQSAAYKMFSWERCRDRYVNQRIDVYTDSWKNYPIGKHSLWKSKMWNNGKLSLFKQAIQVFFSASPKGRHKTDFLSWRKTYFGYFAPAEFLTVGDGSLQASLQFKFCQS